LKFVINKNNALLMKSHPHFTFVKMGSLREENLLGSRQSNAVGCSGDSCEKQLLLFFFRWDIFGHWDILVISTIVVLKLTITILAYISDRIALIFLVTEKIFQSMTKKNKSCCISCQWLVNLASSLIDVSIKSLSAIAIESDHW